jgi:hypothetical protein
VALTTHPLSSAEISERIEPQLYVSSGPSWSLLRRPLPLRFLTPQFYSINSSTHAAFNPSLMFWGDWCDRRCACLFAILELGVLISDRLPSSNATAVHNYQLAVNFNGCDRFASHKQHDATNFSSQGHAFVVAIARQFIPYIEPE